MPTVDRSVNLARGFPALGNPPEVIDIEPETSNVIGTPIITGVLPDDFRRYLYDTGQLETLPVSTYQPSIFDWDYDTRDSSAIQDWLEDRTITNLAPNWAVLAGGSLVLGFVIYKGMQA